MLAPSLRIGYLIAPAPFIERAVAEVTIIDRQGDPVSETAVADLLSSGVIHSHTKKVMKIDAERSDFVASLLQTHLHKWLSFELPVGGLALWVVCQADVDMETLQAAGERKGVRFLPASHFSLKNKPYPALRLGFGSPSQLPPIKRARRCQIWFPWILQSARGAYCPPAPETALGVRLSAGVRW